MTVHGTEQLAPRDDKDVVLAAVTQHGYALQYASADLQNDKDVVLAANTGTMPKGTGFCLRKWLGAITLAALLLTHQ